MKNIILPITEKTVVKVGLLSGVIYICSIALYPVLGFEIPEEPLNYVMAYSLIFMPFVLLGIYTIASMSYGWNYCGLNFLPEIHFKKESQKLREVAEK